MSDIIYREESYRIMGACFEVYKEKGCGFLEAVYQECLEMEFADQGIPFGAQRKLALAYKGRPLKQTYEPDFICVFGCAHYAPQGNQQAIAPEINQILIGGQERLGRIAMMQ